jgi:hypothetical protein
MVEMGSKSIEERAGLGLDVVARVRGLLVERCCLLTSGYTFCAGGRGSHIEMPPTL